MKYTILDCYTDEASGLGVPPYLGTYPRYLFGKLTKEGHDVKYLTIDDLRLWKKYDNDKWEPTVKQKTNILIYNLTKNKASEIIPETDKLIVILGVHVPGKYLTALPGTLKEVIPMLKDIKCEITLTGPAIFGTQLEGGKFFEKVKHDYQMEDYSMSFEELEKYVEPSAKILKQIPYKVMLEIETGRGCNVGKCSFCTEPIKSTFKNRKMEYVVKEVQEFYKHGAKFFRLGKQADYYASDRPIELLKTINKQCPKIEVLHIDNVNPNSVVVDERKGGEITKAIVKYCTPGNIAAFGVESFDPEVVKANLLNTHPIIAMKAIKIINKYGAERGENGMHKYLPGINIIFGLLKETKSTQKKNMESLQQVIDEGFLLRRINIRQVAVLPGTFLEKHGGNKYLRKNKHLYWKWRNEIRQKIDNPMLKLLVPKGTILTDVYTEMYDGKTTFCRQMGTYPLVIGVKGRLPLGKKIKVRVMDYMLRSIVGEVVLNQ